jgi:hypothetical protein
MEASMHGFFDNSGGNDNRTQRSSNIGFWAWPALLGIGLIGLVIAKPAASSWISQAVEAEFAGSFLAPDLAPSQIARPAMQFRTVRAN